MTVEKLRASFAAIGDSFQMDWQIHRADEKMRIVLMVSKFGHCLNDLLFRSRIGALPVEIAAVVSNHTDFAELVGSYDIPFHHIPVTKDTKARGRGASCWSWCARRTSSWSCSPATCRCSRTTCASS